jgi:hypothetical protein
MQNADKRIFYWILFIGLMVPYISPLGLPVAVTTSTQAYYDKLNSLPAGSNVVLSINSGVSAWGDCLPAMVATVKLLVKNNDKIIVWGMGQVDIDITWAKIISEVPALGTTYKYGTDYVYFGYLPTQETTIGLLADNIAGVFSTDKSGTPIANIPLMQKINTAKDIAAVCTSDTGDVQTYYVKLWKDGPSATPVAELGIAMNKSGDMPWFLSGEEFGLVAGSRGGAELEKLVGALGDGTTTMDAINISHLLIVIAIILANIGYFATRGKK